MQETRGKNNKNGILRQRGEVPQGKKDNRDGEILALTEGDRGTTKDH